MNLVNDVATIGELNLYHCIVDDFNGALNTLTWATVLTDSGTAATSDAAGGVLVLTASDGTVADNDEAYVHGQSEAFKFADGKPIVFEARAQWTEANTDDANILIGLKDAGAANSILDDGAGPPASYSGVCFFKADGDTVWSVENSIGTTQKTTQLTAANCLSGVAQTCGAGTYQTLRIEVTPITSTKMDIAFFIDDVLVAKHKDQTMASATEMELFAGVKNGGANNEVLYVDYIACAQKR